LLSNVLENKIKSPEDYGVKLHINKPAWFAPNLPVVIDCETDEQDNFVGLAMTQDGKHIYYWSDWIPEFADFVGSFKYITHNGKSDIRWLKKWGAKVSYETIAHDTKMLAYVMDSSLDSYSLKSLVKKYLGIEYQTYKEMVGVGKKKTTLDKQPIERVGAYCGMDVLATYKLQQYCLKHISQKQIDYYNNIELPMYKLLARMEDKGVYIDVDYLKKLDAELGESVEKWDTQLKKHGDFNPRSPKQLLEIFKSKGLDIKATDVKTLTQHTSIPLVNDLLNYRKYKKLKSTYTEPFLKASTLPLIHGRFTQSTLTGRLASSKPNLQNIPAPDPEHKRFHADVGTKIRKAFVAPLGHKLLVLDYSQIEYRLFAHYTQEPVLLEAYKNGEDIHQRTADLIGFPDNRRLGKTINFAAIYGAGAKRIAETANISEDQATKALNKYWTNLPKASAWVTLTKWKAAKYGYVETILGRIIPIQGINSRNKFERWHAERVAVNATIQGSAADVIKKAMLDIDKDIMLPDLQVHDELMFTIESGSDDTIIYERIKHLMESAVKLSVSVEVNGGYGESWAETKQ